MNARLRYKAVLSHTFLFEKIINLFQKRQDLNFQLVV